MQPAAMDHHLRVLVAGVLAALLLVDELAEAVEEAALAVLDAGRQQLVRDTERGEFAHRMRQQRDADAELLHLRRALVDRAGDAAPMQVEREREPGDAAADDRDLGGLCGIPRQNVPALRASIVPALRRHVDQRRRAGAHRVDAALAAPPAGRPGASTFSP